jgi:Protein of unknown function (DUF2997)
MSEYQKIEYLIDKDGKITERVIDANGNTCLGTTSAIEASLGQVTNRELLPEYYESNDNLITETETLYDQQS